MRKLQGWQKEFQGTSLPSLVAKPRVISEILKE